MSKYLRSVRTGTWYVNSLSVLGDSLIAKSLLYFSLLDYARSLGNVASSSYMELPLWPVAHLSRTKNCVVGNGIFSNLLIY